MNLKKTFNLKHFTIFMLFQTAAVHSNYAGLPSEGHKAVNYSLKEIIDGLEAAKSIVAKMNPSEQRDGLGGFSCHHNSFVNAIRNLPEYGGPLNEHRQNLVTIKPDFFHQEHITSAMIITNKLRLSDTGLDILSIVGRNPSNSSNRSNNSNGSNASGDSAAAASSGNSHDSSDYSGRSSNGVSSHSGGHGTVCVASGCKDGHHNTSHHGCDRAGSGFGGGSEIGFR